jgi:hypothetical protein
MHVDRCGAVAIGRSGEGRGTWCLTAVFVMRGALPGMLLRVCHECVRFISCSARLVVQLGANMMGGASIIRASVGSCEGMLVASSWSSSVTLCPCIRRGEHMAPVADLLVGGICARGA